jgi:hypothetical protein
MTRMETTPLFLRRIPETSAARKKTNPFRHDRRLWADFRSGVSYIIGRRGRVIIRTVYRHH